MYGDIFVAKVSLNSGLFLIFLNLFKVRVISSKTFLILLSCRLPSIHNRWSCLDRINWSPSITVVRLTPFISGTFLSRLFIFALFIPTLSILLKIDLSNRSLLGYLPPTFWLFAFHSCWSLFHSLRTDQYKEFFAVVMEIWVCWLKSSHKLNIESLYHTFKVFESYEITFLILLLKFCKDQTKMILA